MVSCLIAWLFQAKKEQVKTSDKGKSASKAAQANKKGGKAKKKSWTKVKVKDKLNHDVFLDQKRYEKVSQEMTKILCITRSNLCEKFKVNGSVSRALIRDGVKRGHIKPVGDRNAHFEIFTGVQAKAAEEVAAAAAAAAAAKKEKKWASQPA